MPKTTLDDALKKAVKLEEDGCAFYKQCAEKTENKEGKSMFEFLAGEEMRHITWIREALKDAGMNKSIRVLIPDIKDIKSMIFKRKVQGGKADERADALEALNIGINAEKSSIELYRNLGKQCDDDECISFFRKLENEEEKHLSILKAEVEFVTETGEFHDFKTITS
jgi:rubrerythrin